MGGKIDAYLDCVSPYSFYAFKYLIERRAALSSYDVEIDFHPVFLGGINHGSGNKPPWTLPAKGAYSAFDSKRANLYFGTPNFSPPPYFPIVSLLPQRCMTYIKANFPREQYESTFYTLWIALFEEHLDISKPTILTDVLSRELDKEEVSSIMQSANNPEWKQKLLDKTKEALEKGAFGCPWFWVRNGKGEEEPFFGSDRFHYMWEYLGIEWRDIEIVEQKSKL
ncbi:DSBA family oxidoreductase [Saccharata proteae CBS 121410]|uniref:Glutathione S-transferase kappa n=1 Tax=Saccharata proteae CBS 121410 TaxID=1314787 RepID=A0A9P4LVP9_9PEZI|nr:DSBA family oxidoreductase [Saccharata proteae CBS 121410]